MQSSLLGTSQQRKWRRSEKMTKIKKWTNGFQEIAESHPVGMETATSTDEGVALIRDLGRYISELERRLESGQ